MQGPIVIPVNHDMPRIYGDMAGADDIDDNGHTTIWDNLSLVSKEIAFAALRFDIDSEYFDDKQIKSVIFNDDYKQVIEAVRTLEFNDVIILACNQGNYKISKQLACYYSKTLKTMLSNNLLNDGSNMITLNNISLATIELLFAILLNPGSINKFSTHLTRMRVLALLLEAADFLQIDQIAGIITNNINNFLSNYKIMLEWYTKQFSMIHNQYFMRRPQTEPTIEKFKTPCGEYAVEAPAHFIFLFDRHNMPAANKKVLKYAYKKHKTSMTILHEEFLSPKTYVTAIKILEKSANNPNFEQLFKNILQYSVKR